MIVIIRNFISGFSNSFPSRNFSTEDSIKTTEKNKDIAKIIEFIN